MVHSGVVHAHGIMFLAVCILNTAVCSRILHALWSFGTMVRTMRRKS